MADLAESQGGSGSAQAPETDKMSEFVSKGEAILEKFVSSIQTFESQSKLIKRLSDSVHKIQGQLNTENNHNKRPCSSTDDDSNGKKAKVASPIIVTDCDPVSEDEVDVVLGGQDDKAANQNPDTDEFFQDLTEFFIEESDTTSPVSEKVATLVNKSLRGQPDENKAKTLKDKYKRPENVENLQVPKIDKILWEQLKWQTKSTDAARQRSIQRMQEGLIPMIMAMEHVANTKEVNIALIKTYIGDTFKTLCNNIVSTNNERRDAVRKEVQGKYKSALDSPATATGLFGDSLADDIKKLDTKQLQVTTKQSFLGKTHSSGSHNRHYPSFQRKNVSRPSNNQRPYQNRGGYYQRAQAKPSWKNGKPSDSGVVTKKTRH